MIGEKLQIVKKCANLGLSMPYAPRPRREHQNGPKTSWNKVAKWYGSHLQEKDTFQDALVFPGALKLLAPKQGARYLDIACGEGSFAKMVVDAGGQVVGVDAAPSLIKRAQSRQLRGAMFYTGDATRLRNVVRENDFDGAVCILAIQNISHMSKLFADTSTLLKKGAPFVIVMNHPVFRIPRQTSWGWDESKKMQYRRIDSYMTQSEIPIQMNPGDNPKLKTFSYHRPITTYISELVSAGFIIDGIEELTSHRVSDSGPRAKAENRTRNEIPMFMTIRARKA